MVILIVIIVIITFLPIIISSSITGHLHIYSKTVNCYPHDPIYNKLAKLGDAIAISNLKLLITDPLTHSLTDPPTHRGRC